MVDVPVYSAPFDRARLNVSVVILTLNEEQAIGDCLKSLRWTDDIVVLDSFSTDRTKEIAEAYGVRWIEHKFSDWASQQNYAVESIPFKYEWVYLCDADERVTSALAEEILARTAPSANPSEAAFQVRRRDYYNDTWIRRSTNYPLWIVRLFRPEKIRWRRSVNQVPKVDGSVGVLQNDYIHFPILKGAGNWFARHNKYSDLEAIELVKSLDSGDLFLSDLLSSDRTTRRQSLKKLSFRLPGRPFLRFFFLYFVKLGFLDGRMGLRYCLMKAVYQYMIDIKVSEILSRRSPGTSMVETKGRPL